MRTIAILNQKGGCGKTTTAINLAATLAGKGFRVLIVDMDPQSHCALGLSVPEQRIERGTAELLHAGLDGSLGVADLTWQVSRNLDLLPSTMALATMEQRLASQPDKDRRLSQVLSPVADRYDVCVLDCPPSIGLLTFNALRAADEVLIPVETGYFALQGSVRQARTIEMLIQRVGHRVRFSILPTMYDVRTKLAREILGELRKHFDEAVLPCVINFNSKLKEAAALGQPITEYDPSSTGMKDFEELANWLLNHPPAKPEIMPAADAEYNAPLGTADAPMHATPRAPGAFAPGSPAATPADADPASQGSIPAPAAAPAMSRAAELAERARGLSTRTAALSARLAKKYDEQVPPSPSIREAEAPQVSERVLGVSVTKQGVLFVQPMAPGNTCGSNGGQASDTVKNLALAADFNDWNPSKTPLIRNDALGVWQAVVQLPPGRYRYRLVQDGQWVQDPHNPHTETNPFGELNNIVNVPAVAIPERSPQPITPAQAPHALA
ncbi:MAG: AAA family ATPase [Planctomycetota bacterium]